MFSDRLDCPQQGGEAPRQREESMNAVSRFGAAVVAALVAAGRWRRQGYRLDVRWRVSVQLTGRDCRRLDGLRRGQLASRRMIRSGQLRTATPSSGRAPARTPLAAAARPPARPPGIAAAADLRLHVARAGREVEALVSAHLAYGRSLLPPPGVLASIVRGARRGSASAGRGSRGYPVRSTITDQ